MHGIFSEGINKAIFQTLLRAVYKVFADEVDATHALLLPYMSVNQPPFNPNAIPARRRFLNRRAKLIQNIVRWRKYTKEHFGIGGLVSRLLVQDFMPVAESGWAVGGEECARKVSRLFYLILLICSSTTSGLGPNTAGAYPTITQITVVLMST